MVSIKIESKKAKRKAEQNNQDPFMIAIKESFDVFDRNKDGRISVDELGSMMRSLGYNHTSEEIERIIKEVDINKNGTVEFDEFVQLMQNYSFQPPNEVEEHDIRAAFQAFDKNGDGFIEASEIKATMQAMGETISDEEVAEMIKEADIDGNQLIDFSEFTRLMEAMHKKQH